MVRQHSSAHERPLLACILAVGLIAAVSPALAQEPLIRTYEVQFTDTPPTIDGMVEPGEWDLAPEEGDFYLLRNDPEFAVDLENNRFRAMWDQNNLYLLLQSEPFFFTPRPAEDNPAPVFDGSVDNWNLYWDPNLDGDPNVPDPLPPEGFTNDNDGYQIAFGQHEGTSIMQGDNQGGNFLFTEAHVNTGFGNQANWRAGLGDIVIAQVNSDGDGTAELVIPWAELNADAEIDDGMGGTIETGLHHPFAPSNEDVWFFQAARISNDATNFLPIWNWTPSQAFTSHPHGELIFVGAPDVGGVPGDYNNNGQVEQADLDLVLLNWGQSFDTLPDDWANERPTEGIIDQAELDGVLLNWGTTAGGLGANAAVPEPTTGVMCGLAVLAGIAFARRFA